MSRDAAEPKAGLAACAVAAIYSDFISRVRCDSSAGALTEEAFAREVQFYIDAAVKAEQDRIGRLFFDAVAKANEIEAEP